MWLLAVPLTPPTRNSSRAKNMPLLRAGFDANISTNDAQRKCSGKSPSQRTFARAASGIVPSKRLVKQSVHTFQAMGRIGLESNLLQHETIKSTAITTRVAEKSVPDSLTVDKLVFSEEKCLDCNSLALTNLQSLLLQFRSHTAHDVLQKKNG